MAGFGDCRCCKEYKKLTTHHDKQINQKIMICRDCHDIIEEYLKIQAKVLKELKKSKSKKKS